MPTVLLHGIHVQPWAHRKRFETGYAQRPVSLFALIVRVLSFATALDAVGSAETEQELPDGSTVGDLIGRLTALYPALEPLWPRLAVAVDGEVAADRTASLHDGAEVALLPPVSGGSCGVAGGRLRDGAVDADTVEAVRASVEDDGKGAVVVFVGNVRNSFGGRPVERITYSAYRAMAERRVGRIVRELEAAEPGTRVAIVHGLGTLEVGDASVVIATASAHRQGAYETNRLALERLKAEVPIWKREHYTDGNSAWREEEPLE